MDWVVEDKKTGEVVSLICISWGSSAGNVYEIVGKDGVRKKIKEKEFNKRFQKVSFDFSKILPMALQLVDNCEYIRRFLYPIARKLHPGGYYYPGCLVYFQFDNFLQGSEPVKIDRLSHTTYIVTEIQDFPYGGWSIGSEDDCLGSISVARYRGPKVDLDKYDADYHLPLSKDILREGDAYCYLKRYDLPY